MSTVVICALLLVAVFFAVRKLYHDRKAGKTCCGGDCPGCSRCAPTKKFPER